jgi:hypothetical protein
MKIFLTGATGVIGRRLVPILGALPVNGSPPSRAHPPHARFSSAMV